MRLALLFSLALLFVACGPKCPEPQYEGKASDEAYLTMVDAEARATADASKAPTFTGLVSGMALPKTPAQTLYWTSTLTSAASPAAPLPRERAPWYRGLLYSEAWAHLPPVTGVIYWLKISVPAEKCPVEVLTTRNEWSPSAELWAKLTAGSGERSITAQSAYLTENRITEGPFKMPSAVTFTVSP